MASAPAGGERHERNIAFGVVLRQARHRRIERRIGTCGNVRDGELSPPLADLHDDRDVRADRHVRELERTGGVRDGGDERAARDVTAAVARSAARDRRDGRVRHVHDDVVERHLPGRVVHLAAQRGGSAAGARLLLETQPGARSAPSALASPPPPRRPLEEPGPPLELPPSGFLNSESLLEPQAATVTPAVTTRERTRKGMRADISSGRVAAILT